VRRIFWTIFGLWLCGLFVAAGADTYPMTDGTSLTGDVISYNDNGVVFRLDVDKYSQRVPWTKFSQDALKQLANKPENQAAGRAVH
jgi:ribosomal protein S1